MPRATCRCGQVLTFPEDAPDRVICPVCSSKIRVRRASPPPGGGGEEQGYIRFHCPCGRRLKVRDSRPRPEAGKCPDCGRVVPVPETTTPEASGQRKPDVETPTQDLSAEDVARLQRWASRFRAAPEPAPAPAARADVATPPPERAPVSASASGVLPAAGEAPVRVEAGLRVCPRCGRPVHLGAEACRQCGASVPRR